MINYKQSIECIEGIDNKGLEDTFSSSEDYKCIGTHSSYTINQYQEMVIYYNNYRNISSNGAYKDSVPFIRRIEITTRYDKL